MAKRKNTEITDRGTDNAVRKQAVRPKETPDPADPSSGSTTNPDTVDTYVPTGGRSNDPETWRTNPGYGQNFGEANKGAGYNPAFGSWDDYKAGRRDWRARFQPGGANYEKDQLIKASILGAHPQTKEALGSLLNSLGIRDAKEQGQSYYRNMMGMFDNNILGNYHIDPATGRMIDVGTSDVNKGWEGITPDIQNQLNAGFYGRLEGELGVPRFQGWVNSGKSAVEGVTGNGLYYNHSGDGIHYWDKLGYETDENGKRTGGHYMFNNAGGVAGTGTYMPIGTQPGHLLANNPAQNPSNQGYVAPPTGTTSVAARGATSQPPPVPQAPLNRGGVPSTQTPSWGVNPGGSSLSPAWGGTPNTTEPQNAVPSNTTATPALPGTVTTKTKSQLKPLEQAPPTPDPNSNPNLLRLSMLGGKQPFVL